VSEWVYKRLEEMKREADHGSFDSVIRSLILEQDVRKAMKEGE